MAESRGGADLNGLLERALSLHERGDYTAAQGVYLQILKLQPDEFNALNLLGVLHAETGQPELALKYLDRAVQVRPRSADAHFNRALALKVYGDLEAAAVSYQRVLALDPRHADALCNLGGVLQSLDCLEEARAKLDAAIALNPRLGPAYNNRGCVLQKLGRFEAALADFESALALEPDHASAWSNRGAALNGLGESAAAIQSFDKALSLNPNDGEAWHGRGVAHWNLNRPDLAKADYEKAISLWRDSAGSFNNLGNVLHALDKMDEARACYEKAIALQPGAPESHCNLGHLFFDTGRFQEALECYAKVLELQPERAFVPGQRLHAKLRCCDWHSFDTELESLRGRIMCGEQAASAFVSLMLFDDPDLQRRAGETELAALFPENGKLGPLPRRAPAQKIRIGYYSADFNEHPIAWLTAALFEVHDRQRFEIIAFSYGRRQADDMTRRLVAAFDQFVDVRDRSDEEVARLSRQMGIDIAIDLTGLTRDSRCGIFALRAAPVQAGYAGYLGTMAANYMDYLLADDTLIPPETRHYYAEKIVYLPCYQVNDPLRKIADRRFSREELGLPREGFVFCCFNNNFKLNPGVFDSWMRILNAVDGAVLFLYADNELARRNLLEQALSRGVSAQRLVFGGNLPRSEYLARYRAADLFLDTLPYNAGTTASDALWAGLPVLTRAGKSMAARMAAGVLCAAGLPELVTTSAEEYEARAIEIARNPALLAALRQRVEQARSISPLFDVVGFARHLEQAFTTMHATWQAGEAPRDIRVGEHPEG